MSVAVEWTFYDAVLASLRSIVQAVGTGGNPDTLLAVGDAAAPKTHPGFYAIVYPASSGPTYGPLGDVHADEDFVVQVTSVGTTRQQAQWVAGEVKDRLLSTTLILPGRQLMGPAAVDVGKGVSRDDDTAGPPLFYAVHQYRFRTTPA